MSAFTQLRYQDTSISPRHVPRRDYLKVETKRGEAKSEASLNVQMAQVEEVKDKEPAPAFISELQPQVVEVRPNEDTRNAAYDGAVVQEGDAVAMECQLVGGASIRKVEWLKDDAPVPAADPRFVTEQTLDNRISLSIHKAEASDVGVYSCKVWQNPNFSHRIPGFIGGNEAGHGEDGGLSGREEGGS